MKMKKESMIIMMMEMKMLKIKKNIMKKYQDKTKK
jgi:hypothetical protein